jgi:hypothetical protein
MGGRTLIEEGLLVTVDEWQRELEPGTAAKNAKTRLDDQLSATMLVRRCSAPQAKSADSARLTTSTAIPVM